MKSVIVIGGGIAGLAAAAALADEGFLVTLFEKRAVLGGRASTFIDSETGERIDNCQHVTMRCCTNLEDFYRRIGVADKIHYFDTLSFLDGTGTYSRIRGSSLPAPLHTFPSFLTFKALGLTDKLRIAVGLLSILRARHSEKQDELSMSDWVAKTHQTKRAIDRFWRPILVSACNEDLDRISCTHGFHIFRDGFLTNPIAYQIGLPTVPLGDLYTEPALEYLEKRGASIRTKVHVNKINSVGRCVESLTLVDGSTVEADYYVSALTFDLLLKLLSEETAGLPYFSNLSNLEFSPITGVHLWFDRNLEIPPATAILDREMQWVFNKTGMQVFRYSGIQDSDASSRLPPEHSDTRTPEDPNYTYLGLVVSSAKKLANMQKDEIVQLALREVCECFPQAKEAKLVKSHVIKERKATFAPMPDTDRWRPPQRSPLANLFLAGDWTRTGWPATMESAVRSGYLAAEAILQEEGLPKKLLVPDLPSTGLARLLVPNRPV